MARQRGSSWQADVRTPDGKRLRHTFSTQEEATAWEGAARLAIKKGQVIPPAAVPQAGPSETPKGNSLAYLGNVFEHVRRTEWDQARAGPTLIRNARTVVDYFGRDKALAEITSADIASFRVELLGRGLSQSYANRICAALSKMMRVAKDAGIAFNLPKIKYSREEQTRFRYLDEHEEPLMMAYWDAAGEPDQADLCMFLIDSGARCFSEAMTVPWRDFQPGFTRVTFWTTKTGRPRTVPLTARCRAMLERRQKTAGNRAGPFTGIGKSTMRGKWDAMREALGFHDVTPHTLRHTCCTRLLLRGADVKRVMQWMGHSAIVTTMRYAQVRPSGLDELATMLEAA